MTAPAPLKKRLARLNRLEVNTGDETTPVWASVRGCTAITLTIEPNEVDVSDFDSEGWDDSLTTHRKWMLAVTGFEGYTGESGAPVEDPGQAFIKQKGLLTGDEAYAQVRFYRADTEKGYEGRVSVNWSGAGGEVKAPEPFNATLTGSGVLVPYAVPATPRPAPE